jgi:hypothetical protein
MGKVNIPEDRSPKGGSTISKETVQNVVGDVNKGKKKPKGDY